MATGIVEYIKTTWGTEDPKVVAQQISEGQRLPTEALGFGKNAEYRAKVVQAGGADGILDFLLKTDQPFDRVKKGGDLPCPSIWLNVLNNFCQEGWLQPESLSRQLRYKIAINLGPIFKDMSNFEKRELFGSRDYWIKSLVFFVSMLSEMLTSKFEKLGEYLTRQAAIKNFLVRLLFLQIGDPEVYQEILEFSDTRDTRIPKPDITGLSQTYCAVSLKSLIVKNGKQLIEEVANTPIRPEHNLTVKAGIIPLLQRSDQEGWYQGGYSATLNIFLVIYDCYERLSSEMGVDSAPSKMVGICRNHLGKRAHLARDRFFLENVMTGIVALGATMMTPSINQRQAPIDYHVASAIHNGLFDFCLDVCDSNDIRLTQTLEGFLKLVASTVSLPETKKALEEHGTAIRCRMERVLARLPYLYTGLNIINAILKQVLPETESANDKACEFCFEKCSKGTTTKCSFCRSVIYCSKDCQRLNWMLHQTTCFEARKTPLPKTSKEIVTEGKLVFSELFTQMLFQASLKNISILDVFVILDMNEITPLLQTLNLEQFSSMYILDEDKKEAAQKIFEKNKSNGSLSVVFVGFTEDGLDAPLLSFPADTVPHLPGLNNDIEDGKKWEAAQQFVSQVYARDGGIKKIQGHPRLLRAAILKTMKP